MMIHERRPLRESTSAVEQTSPVDPEEGKSWLFDSGRLVDWDLLGQFRGNNEGDLRGSDVLP